jgi:hypothetical protein
MSTEYNHIIDEAFQRGLPPKDTLGNNLQFLETAINLKATERGGIAHSAVAMPWTLPSAVAGPHPRYHPGEKQKLLAYETTLYTVNPTTWATAAEPMYNPASVDAVVVPDQGTDAETDWHSTAGRTRCRTRSHRTGVRFSWVGSLTPADSPRPGGTRCGPCGGRQRATTLLSMKRMRSGRTS